MEIREEVGQDNFFLFGLTAGEVQRHLATGYHPREYCDNDDELRAVLDLIDSGLFSHGDTGLFRPLTENLRNHDPFMVLADFRAYIDCQGAVGHAWRDRAHWNRMSILNVARMGKFSSDRSVQEYCDCIWKTKSVTVKV